MEDQGELLDVSCNRSLGDLGQHKTDAGAIGCADRKGSIELLPESLGAGALQREWSAGPVSLRRARWLRTTIQKCTRIEAHANQYEAASFQKGRTRHCQAPGYRRVWSHGKGRKMGARENIRTRGSSQVLRSTAR